MNDIKILKYQDYNQAVKENDEPFVLANKFDSNIDLKSDLKKTITEEDKKTIFWIRETVAKKLANVNQNIQKILGEDFILQLGFGFRSMETQQRFFQMQIDRILSEQPNISKEEMYELAHEKVAKPSVSGHPTGGALDVTIFNKKTGKEIDMGTPLSDTTSPEFREKMKSITTEISAKQRENREILQQIMTAEEFAPFWGEWWHYSFGDCEWATYYEKPNAIYSQKTQQEILNYQLNN